MPVELPKLLFGRCLGTASPVKHAPREAATDEDSYVPLAPDAQSRAAAAASRAQTVGFKAANLARLATVVGSAAKVPAFVAVEHEVVSEHLRAHAPELEPRWREVSAQVQAAGHVDAAAATQLAQLQALIQTAFVEHPLSLDPAYLRQHSHAPSMVRSTGLEDTATLSNAGGNESIANVPTRPEALSAAMGQVVASYLSPKSLQQRLLANDRVDAPLFMPVLVQVMVGEKSADEVPVAGVMFTREAEGQTPGVVAIEASWGHNEGVVTGAAATDAVFYHQGRSHCVIRPKPFRLAPDANATLSRVDNPAALQKRAAVAPGVQARLAELGQTIHSEYGCPMDIEWVYDPAKDEICVVQARPLVLKPVSQPSYLNITDLPQAPQLPGTLIVSGGAQVQVLTKPWELLCKPTLAAALRAYLDTRARRAPRVVAVQQLAPATSHEATVLRGRGVVVVQLDQPEMLRQWLGQSAVGIDAQTGLCVRAPRGQLTRAVQPGWRHHPIALQLTLTEDAGLAAPELHNLITTLLDQGFGAATPSADTAEALRTLFAAAQQQRAVIMQQTPAGGHWLLRLLNAVETTSGTRQTAQILALLWREVALTVHHVAHREPSLVPLAQRVLRQVGEDVDTVLQARLNGEPEIAQRFALRWLRAVISQPANTQVLGSEAWLTLLNESQALQQTRRRQEVTEQAPLLPSRLAYLAQYDKVTRLAWRPEVATAWQQCCDYVVRHGTFGLHQRWARVVTELQRLEATAMWLNVCFPKAWGAAEGQANREEACVDALCREFIETNSQHMLRWAAGVQQQSETWQQQRADWEDPHRFPQLLARLEAETAHVLRTWQEHSSDTAGLAVLTSLSALQNYVNALDVCIKTVSGMPTQGDVATMEKAHRFGKMLKCYGALAEGVGRTLLTSADLPRDFNQVFNRIAALQQARSRWLTPRDLTPSRDFNVSAALVTSPGHFERYQPVDLEDFFTLAHQNTLAAIQRALVQKGLDAASLPAPLQLLCQSVEQARLTDGDALGNLGSHPTLSGIVEAAGQLTACYNLPMRNHAGLLRLQGEREETGAIKVVTAEFNLFSFWPDSFRRARQAALRMLGRHVAVEQAGTRGLKISWQIDARQETELKAWAYNLPGVVEVLCLVMFRGVSARRAVVERFPTGLLRPGAALPPMHVEAAAPILPPVRVESAPVGSTRQWPKWTEPFARRPAIQDLVQDLAMTPSGPDLLRYTVIALKWYDTLSSSTDQESLRSAVNAGLDAVCAWKNGSNGTMDRRSVLREMLPSIIQMPGTQGESLIGLTLLDVLTPEDLIEVCWYNIYGDSFLFLLATQYPSQADRFVLHHATTTDSLTHLNRNMDQGRRLLTPCAELRVKEIVCERVCKGELALKNGDARQLAEWGGHGPETNTLLYNSLVQESLICQADEYFREKNFIAATSLYLENPSLQTPKNRGELINAAIKLLDWNLGGRRGASSIIGALTKLSLTEEEQSRVVDSFQSTVKWFTSPYPHMRYTKIVRQAMSRSLGRFIDACGDATSLSYSHYPPSTSSDWGLGLREFATPEQRQALATALVNVLFQSPKHSHRNFFLEIVELAATRVHVSQEQLRQCIIRAGKLNVSDLSFLRKVVQAVGGELGPACMEALRTGARKNKRALTTIFSDFIPQAEILASVQEYLQQQNYDAVTELFPKLDDLHREVIRRKVLQNLAGQKNWLKRMEDATFKTLAQSLDISSEDVLAALSQPAKGLMG